MQQLKSGPLSEGASTVSIGLVEDRTVPVAAVVPEVSLPLPVIDEARSDLAVNYGLEYSILRTEEGRLLEKRKLLYYFFRSIDVPCGVVECREASVLAFVQRKKAGKNEAAGWSPKDELVV